jgi:serine/threonine protein kinase
MDLFVVMPFLTWSLPFYSTAANVGFIHHRTRQTLKVFDMDMSRVLPRDKNGSDDPNIDVYPQLTLQVGSRRYIGPEVARSEAYNLKSDVYSFGLIVWEMLSMHKPYAEFEAMSEAVHDNHNDGIFFDGPAELDEAILVEGRLRPTVPLAHWNQEVCDFVEDCWSHDVSARPTMKEALHRLQEIHATLSSKDCTVMVPASDKNQVCDMHDKTHKSVESETSFGEGPSIVTLPPAAARPTVAKISIQKDTAASSITATSSKTERSQSADDSSDSSSTTPTESSPRQPSPAMKKSNSWCSLVSLVMVDQEDTDDDDEYFEEEGEGVERSPEGKQRSDQPFTV